jgi:hypothetical protein
VAQERAVPAEVVRDAGAPAPAAVEAPGRGAAPAPAAAAGAGAGAVDPQALVERAADAVVEAEVRLPGVSGAQPDRAEIAAVAGAAVGAPGVAPAGVPRAAPEAVPPMLVAGEARGAELSRVLTRSQATMLAAGDEAALRSRAAEGAIAVPGLPVLSVEAAREDLPAGTLRVLQLLDGDTLELLHLPAGVDPSAVGGPGDPGRTQVAVRHGAGWLLGRARAAAEVLDSLLARVTGGG